MKSLIFASAILMSASSVRAQDFDPATAKALADRIARLEARQDEQDKKINDVDKKLDGVGSKLDAILAAVAPKTAPQVAQLPAPTAVALPPVKSILTTAGTRAPIGHTHTCANGHTWDHTMTPGHNCPFCGLPQTIQDPVPRMVSGGTATASSGSSYNYSLQQSSFSSSSGGCANGSCAAPQTTMRRGIFGFRR